MVQFVKGSGANTKVLELALVQMAEKLGYDPDLCGKLIPSWELGCRRITPGEGYLETFLRHNVGLTQSPITQVKKDGIETADGRFYPVDVGGWQQRFSMSERG